MSSLHVSLRVEPGSLYRVSVGSSEGIYEVSAVVDIVVSVAMVLQRKVGFPFISDDSSSRSNKLQDQQAECVCVSRVVRTFYQEAFAAGRLTGRTALMGGEYLGCTDDQGFSPIVYLMPWRGHRAVPTGEEGEGEGGETLSGPT